MNYDARVVLSRRQAAALLEAREQGSAVIRVSPDLGLTTVDAELEPRGVRVAAGELMTWSDVERIADAENICFLVEGGEVEEIRVFSKTTGWVRSLIATDGAPTTLVAGFPMHRLQGIDPWADTLRKIRAAAPIVGHVLDTATGLGYTAIEAAKTAERVVTIELDPAGLDIARHNPWSRALFDNPRIEQIVGDAGEEIRRFPDGSFSRVLHDPPTMRLAGDLYSGAFYREVHRVLTRNGHLFHYIGDPESASGRGVTRGVMRRLTEAGFRRVVRRPEAFGLLAFK